MTAIQYCGTTFREYLAKKDHYLKIKYERACENRNICFVLAASHLQSELSIYEFMPLEGDPTPEEIEQMQVEEQHRLYQQAIAYRKQLSEQMQKY